MAKETMNIAITENRGSRWMRRAVFALIVGGICAAPFLLAVWSVQRANAVVNTQDVGEIISAEFLQGFTEDKTRIATTRGTFLVFGTFQAFKGNGASLELRGNSNKYLCDTTTKTCKKLVE